MKRKRGKKFEWQGNKSLDVERSVKSRSVFRDKRLGEKNPNLSLEDKYLLRFQRERELKSRRKQRFELDDALELTHKGQRLSDLKDDYVEDYDLDISDDESKPHKLQKLSDDIVNQEHFGGDGRPRSKRDAYEELILRSKQNKAQRQQEKEDNMDITRKLDGDFDDISRRLKFKEKGKAEIEDEFDLLMNEIKDDTKMMAEGKGDLKCREIRREMMENGENWDVPEGFKEFVLKVRDDALSAIQNMKIWTDCDVRRERTEKQERLLLLSLRYFVEEMEDGEFQVFEEMKKTLFNLCKEYQKYAEKCFEVVSENLPESLNLSLPFLYHLVYLTFPLDFQDKLTWNFSYYATDLLVSYPLLNEKTCRNLLLLSKVLQEKWFPNRFSPEICRFLLRFLQSLTPELSTSLSQYFPAGAEKFASDLVASISQKFSKYPAFQSIFLETNLNIQEAEKVPLKLYERPIEEIETFEPLIYENIKSNKKNKDLNKEVTELDRLREQQKRARKLAKKALEKETEVDLNEKDHEFHARVQAQERKQGLVKNMLDELQVEYKKFDTTLERKKDKKKRKERMAGGRTEMNKKEFGNNKSQGKGGRKEKKGFRHD